MNAANAITLLRLILIPIFGMFAVMYGRSIVAGAPEEMYRYAALISFTVAALSDGIDGYIARKYHMESRLGSILDPLADKLLMLTGLVTLSIVPWGENDWILPFWYIYMVLARDVSIGIGCAMIISLGQKLEVHPHWTGKATTVAQLFTIGWLMLKVIPFSPIYPTLLAAILTLWSSWAYVLNAIRQLNPKPAA
ncbi:CDP-diacylglycerol--glycerol-3-phosphate 3-phosphatidyltransferase [Rubritalea squalenifaciens DSM 18772]|uniref:CDP-diacylglycerol--glycerol-3-phosphate 3-phosphatidyltransferase n=1 Tax=Rubritalea squalenifaciens DSM 18772 TaxID=1123071 RepID=A0A1M6JBP7_9BACT|nr:CDP-diacylglycerol--glycerol-3-phosphate 3-phosphatidyltransferase [Rubritalea squalenifaciens]SHJ44115.1 CDP-diacylglycerol--glycerol-3-phosphate 3-phosphatidyltransferase [Rubritalea squalenifaciens DSM 18772]